MTLDETVVLFSSLYKYINITNCINKTQYSLFSGFPISPLLFVSVKKNNFSEGFPFCLHSKKIHSNG